MKIALLGPAHSIHTIRWANGLANRGVDTHVLSLTSQDDAYNPRVSLHRLPWGPPQGYLLAAPALRRTLREIGPDLLNTHYATGYGTLARLAGFTPSLLSAWGSDIYAFPYKSGLHRRVLRGNLDRATAVAVTGQAMARQVRQFTDRPVHITPFGIDTECFSPAPTPRPDNAGPIVIGTVKGLETTYGIDILLQAFAQLLSTLEADASAAASRLLLKIYGSGSQAQALQAMATELGIADRTQFLGHIAHSDVPAALRDLDVYVALSRMDSFGVAILEACACSIPVLVSDADGPAEIVVDGVTGYVVPRLDAGAAATRLRQLVADPALRRQLGEAGRAHVQMHYSWQASLDSMLGAYQNTLRQYRNTDAGTP
ncbi:glycosyltransferase [Achromobacter sp. MY14]|uniref:glycosyltransferase n=1 Tax=Achromobacter TaxID=222 RepID=UPI000F8F9626|nr:MULTISPECIES: glycosyltransferase [Achromobacter]AZS82255.1 glycosyltransferase family 4 protein [Achromobacter spanius]MCD0496505.1 glycosyltransferase [Achromobacter sp. MY14]